MDGREKIYFKHFATRLTRVWNMSMISYHEMCIFVDANEWKRQRHRGKYNFLRAFHLQFFFLCFRSCPPDVRMNEARKITHLIHRLAYDPYEFHLPFFFSLFSYFLISRLKRQIEGKTQATKRYDFFAVDSVRLRVHHFPNGWSNTTVDGCCAYVP